MKNLLILTFIFSSIFLASCWKEIEYKKISNTEVNKRIEIANNYLANFNINIANEYLSDSKTDTNLSWKISATWDWHTLKTKWFTCENIIPYLEYQINWYNNEIWYFWKYWDFENNPWIYDWYFLEYDGFIKLKYKEKDINDICLYWASFLSNTWWILDNTDETVWIYKEWIFEYIDNFWLEKYNNHEWLPKTKNEIAKMWFEYWWDTRQNRILDNNWDKYFNTIWWSIQLMFNTDITSYLEYLAGISDNFINESTTFNINENWIY